MPGEWGDDVDDGLSVRGLFERATAVFRKSGIAEPRREAARLIADLLGRTPGEVSMAQAAAVRPERSRMIVAAIERRAGGEPLAHVTGLAGFRNLVLESDRRALIPRPETEGLVDRALARAAEGVAIDVGTGTGCLALALREEGRYRAVIGIDRSAEALALARRNRGRTALAVSLIRGDLTTSIGAARADVLVSNPPYLTRAEYLALDPAVRDHEPREALESGHDGLDATRSVLGDGLRVVRPGGWIVLEIAAARPDGSAAAARAAGWHDVTIDDDLFGRPRYLIARRET